MRGLVLTVLTVLAALGAAPAALADTASSTNWAGYAVHGGAFRRVLGTWRQPAVACRPGVESYSAYWVGLGGFSTGAHALEQIGTEADCAADGTQHLSAWLEMVPAASVSIPMVVSAGDVIDAAVTVRGHLATLWLRDRTRHHLFSRDVRSPQIDVSSAEWIVEAPSDCSSGCVTLPLADFGATLFTSALTKPVLGRWGSLSDPRFTLTTIHLEPGGAGHIAAAAAGAAGSAAPGALSEGGTAFTVAFVRGVDRLHAPVARRRRGAR